MTTPGIYPVPEPGQPIANPVTPPPTYRDRSTGLTVFGIIQIILGGLAALMVPFMLLGALFSRKTGTSMPAGTYVGAICSYSFIAALLVTLGIGAIRGQRWARALNLISSWLWLLVGTFATIGMIAILPTTFKTGMHQAANSTPNVQPVPMGVMAVILTVVIICFSVFGVVLPLAFLLFYSRKDVEETCKQRDPVERWTDRCPLPVLAVSLLLAWSAFYYLLTAVTTPIVPFFGRYLDSWSARLVCVGLFALNSYVAISIYKLRIAAWWITVGGIVLRLISTVVTFRHTDPSELYSKMGWAGARADQLGANPAFRGGVKLGIWSTVTFALIFFGYMIWIKRYFHPKVEPPGLEPAPQLQMPSDGIA